ncbi:MAG: ATP-NAD kinase family protein [Candidatus Ranarchaeia archaeon]
MVPTEDSAVSIGLVINPIAGMGGRVGLKGTDGPNVLGEAIRRGAKPIANQRARTTFKYIQKKYLDRVHWFVAPGLMGEHLMNELGLRYTVVIPIKKNEAGLDTRHTDNKRFTRLGETSSEDTINIAYEMKNRGIRLLLFFGGDGTAANIADAIDLSVPVIGVPTGVKMFSAVFALTPKAAAKLFIQFMDGETHLEERDVLDIDEERYRRGELIVKLKGILQVPVISELVQSSKEASGQGSDEQGNRMGIVKSLMEEWDPSAIYLLGPGTTVKAVASALNIEHSLLGVDVVKGSSLLLKDADEEQILKCLDNHKGNVYLLLSPIGRQGFLLGRGNQQISPAVLRRIPRDNIRVLATHAKMRDINCLYVDTGDHAIDEKYRGYIRVLVDYREELLVPVK